jgi:alpha-D-ribose 1-methylphosphonate 5-triphosphate synthase subunit PhnL
MRPRLEVSDLSKRFTLHVLGGKRLSAFEGVSFRVDPGECLHICGPSGAGKSSLLKCLYRTYPASSGYALLHSGGATVDLVSAPDLEVLELRRSAIGYVSQFFSAIPRLTALTVVAEPLLSSGTDPAAARRRAQEMLERLDIPEALWDCYPSTFSGGERQRVNLARALIAPRALILLDEPTASLDRVRRAIVLSLLAELKRAGTSLVLVFHDAERPALVDGTLWLQEVEHAAV